MSSLQCHSRTQRVHKRHQDYGTGTVSVTNSWTYDVFGAVRSHAGTNGTEFTFTGEQNDPNGLEYLRARYYDSATGRFLGGDPLGGGYAYAGNNPVNRSDPTGLYEICGDNPDWGYICFDSVDVGLPANAPDACSVVTNMCVWYDTGFIAACNCQADGGNQAADAVAGCVSGIVTLSGHGAMCGGPPAQGGGGGCGLLGCTISGALDFAGDVVSGGANHAADIAVGGTLVVAGAALTIGAIAVGSVVIPTEFALCMAGEEVACFGVLHTVAVLGAVAGIGVMVAMCGVEIIIGPNDCNVWD